MTPLLLLAVGVAGGAGAGLRYLADIGVGRLLGARFPWGILVVNITGSFALGVVTGTVSDGELAWVLGAGLLGGYTTFSAVAVETWLLAEEDRRRAAAANAVGSVIVCLGAAALGLVVGVALAQH